ncbi:hypothetical protein LTR36_010054 [Oleoguttula mirabilis]|uniref:Transglycosylase SLT domain-containing protein n=1 Tax=Oleoguttula mirabilis TaxID=1507867 RepID=A0AAV9JRU0_9PEZI|nr:hypothetical protein LTR36_010054 [Oleoguttula mirabilis]
MPKPERYYSQNYSLVDNPVLSSADVRGYDEHPLNHVGAERTGRVEGATRAPPADYDSNSMKKSGGWTRKKKMVVFGSIAALAVIIAIVVGVAVSLSHGSTYSYTPLTVQVTNDTAFTDGGATRQSANNVSDGIGAGTDVYKYYSGTAANFPDLSAWVSFENMWEGNLHTLQHSCKLLGDGANNSPKVIDYIFDAIQNRADASLVDHRFIFAVILQESNGCVLVKSSKSSSGVKNPGLMQSHNGHSYSAAHSNVSITAMVQDGTQGTDDGDGLVQNLDNYGDAYRAARGYNSGYIPTSGNLSEAAGATACYVSDIANRLTGWVNATNTCTES